MTINSDASGERLWGPFMEDAFRLIDAPFLHHTPNKALDYGHSQDAVKLWVRLASLLHIEGTDAGETLLKLQQYIAVTPPEKRFPCEHGTSCRSRGTPSPSVMLLGPVVRGNCSSPSSKTM